MSGIAPRRAVLVGRVLVLAAPFAVAVFFGALAQSANARDIVGAWAAIANVNDNATFAQARHGARITQAQFRPRHRTLFPGLSRRDDFRQPEWREPPTIVEEAPFDDSEQWLDEWDQPAANDRPADPAPELERRRETTPPPPARRRPSEIYRVDDVIPSPRPGGFHAAMRVGLVGVDPEIADFYERFRLASLWFDEERFPQREAFDGARALVEALKEADTHALPIAGYNARSLAASLERVVAGASDNQSTSLHGLARLELALTEAYLAYASDVSSGFLEPRQVDAETDLDRPTLSATELLLRAARAGDKTALMASLPPQSEDYQRLRAAYAMLRDRALTSEPPAISAPDTLRPDMRSAAVAALSERLTYFGDFEPGPDLAQTARSTEGAAASDPAFVDDDVAPTAGVDGFDPADVILGPVVLEPIEASDGAPAPGRFIDDAGDRDTALYDAELEAAVRRFQARHGLEVDGLAGAKTLAAANMGLQERAARVAANMERVRWMNRPLGERRVIVNIPDFHAELIDGDQTLLRTRVVVGEADRHETPEFSDEMTHVVVNPRWHVPHSIATEEFLPKLMQDPGYLAQNRMRLFDGEGVEVDASLVDWRQYSSWRFPFRIQQSPGPGNALGDVKFIFPNEHAVYLHDTPARSLFAQNERDFSHGCVRVADPTALAEHLLSEQSDNPLALYNSIRRDAAERYVRLDQPLPVHIVYRTMWVDPKGPLQFRSDIYGRDALLVEAMRGAGVDL